MGLLHGGLPGDAGDIGVQVHIGDQLHGDVGVWVRLGCRLSGCFYDMGLALLKSSRDILINAEQIKIIKKGESVDAT